MDMAKIAVASATSFLLGSVLTAVGFLGVVLSLLRLRFLF